MAIVAISRQKYIDESVSEAVSLCGGLKFIERDDTVLIKPAVDNDLPSPATVSEQVVRSLSELCLTVKPEKLIVADRSNYSYSTLQAMKKTGIYPAIIESGAEIVDYDEGPWTRLYNDEAKLWLDGLEAPSFLINVDKMINLCLCKTHRLTGFNGALVNLIGLINPKDRINGLHRTHEEPAFSERIAELNLFFKSNLTVMDATSVFLDEGPESGLFAHPGIIIASDDPVAADIVGMALLKSLGAKGRLESTGVWEMPQVKRSISLGLGPKNPGEISLKGNIPEIENVLKFINTVSKAA